MHLIQVRLVTFQLKLEKKLTAHPGSGTLQVTFYRQTAVLRVCGKNTAIHLYQIK
jgi:hypothetical protein